MSDNYILFSESLMLYSKAQKEWVEAELADPTTVIPDGADGPLEFEKYMKQWVSEHQRIYDDAVDETTWPGFDWEIQRDGVGWSLWLHDSGGHSNLEILSVFIQRFLAKFQSEKYVSITYAETCSSPRIGEFGGGAFVVTAKRIKWFSVYEDINKYLKKIGPKAKKKGKCHG